MAQTVHHFSSTTALAYAPEIGEYWSQVVASLQGLPDATLSDVRREGAMLLGLEALTAQSHPSATDAATRDAPGIVEAQGRSDAAKPTETKTDKDQKLVDEVLAKYGFTRAGFVEGTSSFENPTDEERAYANAIRDLQHLNVPAAGKLLNAAAIKDAELRKEIADKAIEAEKEAWILKERAGEAVFTFGGLDHLGKPGHNKDHKHGHHPASLFDQIFGKPEERNVEPEVKVHVRETPDMERTAQNTGHDDFMQKGRRDVTVTVEEPTLAQGTGTEEHSPANFMVAMARQKKLAADTQRAQAHGVELALG